MTLPKFEYIRPKTTEELLSVLADRGGDARLLAGGTDLTVLMRNKVVEPKYVIDVKGIKDLGGLSYAKGKGLEIGAAVTLNEILNFEVIRDKFGAIWAAVNSLADPIVRNRATLVGNICNASPAADSAPALLVLDAEVNVASKEGERTVPIQEFFTGVKRTSLKPGEFVKLVTIPDPPDGTKSDYIKWGRSRGEDLALVGVAALVTGGERKTLRIALSSVAPVPLYVQEVEEVLKEKGTVDEQIKRVVAVVKEKISPITDLRSSKEYRRHIAGVLTERILKSLLKEGG